MKPHDDFEVEPIPGIPALPPKGEDILWQGTPRWKSLARRAFHTKKLSVYAVLLLVWHVADQVVAGEAYGTIAVTLLWLFPLAAAAVGLPALLAWLMARSTIYTITSRRVIIRFGIALPMTINIPYAVVDAAALRAFDDDTGDIPLTLSGSDRIAYLHLWPNARPWHVRRPEPMLRALEQPEKVADILAQALATAKNQIARNPVRSTAGQEHPAAAEGRMPAHIA